MRESLFVHHRQGVEELCGNLAYFVFAQSGLRATLRVFKKVAQVPQREVFHGDMDVVLRGKPSLRFDKEFRVLQVLPLALVQNAGSLGTNSRLRELRDCLKFPYERRSTRNRVAVWDPNCFNCPKLGSPILLPLL